MRTWRNQLSPAEVSRQQTRLRRLRLGVLGWLVATAVILICRSTGLLPIPIGQQLALHLLAALFLLGLYLLTHFNLNLRFRDPSLTLPHLLFGVFIALWVISHAGEVRPILLLLFSMVMLYGIFRLRAAAYYGLALTVSSGLALLVAYEILTDSLSRPLKLVSLEVVIFAIVMFWTAFIGTYVSRLRQSLHQRNRELEEASRRLKHLAHHDELTGMVNRRRLLTLLEQAQQKGTPFSVAMFDLDHFKRINDRYGHGVGDEVLAEFARRVERELRGEDQSVRIDDSITEMGRFGGEEFLALFPDTDLEGALRATERVRRRIQEAPFATSAGPVQCTTSAGVAESRAGEPLKCLLTRADQALYEAKFDGRDRIKSEPPGSPEGAD